MSANHVRYPHSFRVGAPPEKQSRFFELLDEWYAENVSGMTGLHTVEPLAGSVAVYFEQEADLALFNRTFIHLKRHEKSRN